MNYARIQNNIAIETFVPPTGFSLEECFHPDVASQFQSVPDEVQAGWILENDTWVAPPIPEPIVTEE